MKTATIPVESLVDNSPIKDLSEEHTERLKDDLASGIHPAATIGKRYGLGDEAGLRRYLLARPWIVLEAKARKALLESEHSTADRIKLKSQIAYEEVIPAIAGIALSERTPAKERIEAAKELRNSGSIGVTGKDNATPGNQFSLTINMPGGRTEKIITTVVDPAELPAPTDE